MKDIHYFLRGNRLLDPKCIAIIDFTTITNTRPCLNGRVII